MKTDRFGLPDPPRVATVLTTKAEAEARAAVCRSVVAELFRTLCLHVGKEEARRLFVDVAKSPAAKAKKGRPMGAKNKEQWYDDENLLMRYDICARYGMVGARKGDLIAWCRDLRKSLGDGAGKSVEGIKKRISGLLVERELKRAELLERQRQEDEARAKAGPAEPSLPSVLSSTSQLRVVK
jgi:hypothetical protein